MRILIPVTIYERPKFDALTTTVNTYANITVHAPNDDSEGKTFWNVELLGSKTLYFTAATKDLLVKILGSLDGGATFPITAEPEFTVAVGAPIIKDIANTFHALRVQVKPAVENNHGTLTITGSGSTNPGTSDVEITADTSGMASQATLAAIQAAMATAAKQDSLIAKFPDQVSNKVPVVGPITDAELRAADVKVSLDSEKVAISAIDAGTNLIGKVGIDQTTANANEVVLKSITAGPLPDTSGADLAGAHSAADAINGKITACNTGAVVLAAGEAHAGSVGGHVAIVTGTLTRPNDTPGAYSAKDEINTSTSSPTYITFSNVARVANGTGVICVVTEKVNNAGATAQLRLHLYNAAPTPCNDHAAFAQLWADRAKYVGYIDFGAPVVEGTGSDMAMVQVASINLPFTCAGGSRDLYGRVEVIVAGAAPAASQAWDFQLRALVD